MSAPQVLPNGSNSAALPSAIERLLIDGDLSQLTSDQRVIYYNKTCDSLGLNPLTKPFEYIKLNNKLTLYARRDCTDQLRKLNGVSIEILAREAIEGLYVVSVRATDKMGRRDESLGAVSLAGLHGEAKANALMKCETKAKRRVTLSICGLGILDETEVSTIADTGPIYDRSHDRAHAVVVQRPVETQRLAETRNLGASPAVPEHLYDREYQEMDPMEPLAKAKVRADDAGTLDPGRWQLEANIRFKGESQSGKTLTTIGVKSLVWLMGVDSQRSKLSELDVHYINLFCGNG